MSNEKNYVKMADMDIAIAATVFQMLNREHVEVIISPEGTVKQLSVIDANPEELLFPEGWYLKWVLDEQKNERRYWFRNKHNSTTGVYQEIRITLTVR